MIYTINFLIINSSLINHSTWANNCVSEVTTKLSF